MKIKKKIGIVFFVMVVSFMLATSLFAQTVKPITPEDRTLANQYLQAQNWEKAAESYGTIANAEPQNAGALYRLGVALHKHY